MTTAYTAITAAIEKAKADFIALGCPKPPEDLWIGPAERAAILDELRPVYGEVTMRDGEFLFYGLTLRFSDSDGIRVGITVEGQ